jgi:hypothetical protein
VIRQPRKPDRTKTRSPLLQSRPKLRRRPNPKGGDAGGSDGGSLLPSALEAFADVSGPPDFLRHRVAEPEEGTEALGVLDRRGKEGSKQPPPGK